MALQFRWQDAADEADPGAGNLNYNDASLPDVTAIAISIVDRFGNDVSTWLDGLDAPTSTVKGLVRIEHVSDGSAWAEYALLGVAILDSESRLLAVTFRGQGVALDDNDIVNLTVAPAGDKGDAGADGADGEDGADGADGVTTAPQWLFSTATTEDLDTGQVRFDAADPADATYLLLDDVGRSGGDMSALIPLMASAINPDYRSIVTLYKVTDQSVFVLWKVTGDAEEGSGIWRLPGELFGRSGDPILLDDPVAIDVDHAPGKGDKGDQGDPGTAGTNGSNGTPFDPETLRGTSASALAIGVFKVFVTQTNRIWQTGQRLRASSLDGAKLMEGAVSEYFPSTGNLTLSVDLIKGSGIHNQWFISIAGEQGIAGLPGEKGDTGEGLTFNVQGTLAARDAYDSEAEGFLFLQTDITPFALWIKATGDAGDWAGPTYIGGTPFAFGDWGSVADAVEAEFDLGGLDEDEDE